MTNVMRRLYSPVDIASLVCFRVLFGGIMVWEALRYFSHDWIRRYYIDPTFHFTYYGLGWVRPWPGDWMYVHFACLGFLALYIAIGLFYRLSAVLFFLGFTYVFLLDQAQYLNHFYLVSIISFLMIFVPAHRTASVDTWLRATKRSDVVPAWSLWVLRAQFVIVYFYAGVAKINADWLAGEPMRMWLAKMNDRTLLGPFLPVGRLLTEEWVVYIFSYGGLLLDLVIGPLLLWRRSRPYAFAAGLFFHVTNNWLFHIGIFPWFAIAGMLLFFDPDWPRRIFNWPRKTADSGGAAAAPRGAERAALLLLGVHLLLQIVLPLRHFLYPGEVGWTEEGHRFAWHMKLRGKSAEVSFEARDPVTGRIWSADPRDYLSPRQTRKMSTRPDMILQFCHHVADEYTRAEGTRPEVRAEVLVSLNGRPRQLMIDPTVDLASVPRTLGHEKRILPLETPLPRPGQEEADAGPDADD